MVDHGGEDRRTRRGCQSPSICAVPFSCRLPSARRPRSPPGRPSAGPQGPRRRRNENGIRPGAANPERAGRGARGAIWGGICENGVPGVENSRFSVPEQRKFHAPKLFMHFRMLGATQQTRIEAGLRDSEPCADPSLRDGDDVVSVRYPGDEKICPEDWTRNSDPCAFMELAIPDFCATGRQWVLLLATALRQRSDSAAGRVRQRSRPRGLPGTCQGPAGEAQRPVQAHLPPAPQGNRVAVQPCRQVQNTSGRTRSARQDPNFFVDFSG